MPLRRQQQPSLPNRLPLAHRAPPPQGQPSPDAGSSAVSPSPPQEGLEGSSGNSLERGLQSVMRHLYSNPEVAYVLGSIKKGLAEVDVAALSEADKQALLDEIREALERSPSVLQALAEFRG